MGFNLYFCRYAILEYRLGLYLLDTIFGIQQFVPFLFFGLILIYYQNFDDVFISWSILFSGLNLITYQSIILWQMIRIQLKVPFFPMAAGQIVYGLLFENYNKSMGGYNLLKYCISNFCSMAQFGIWYSKILEVLMKTMALYMKFWFAYILSEFF